MLLSSKLLEAQLSGACPEAKNGNLKPYDADWNALLWPRDFVTSPTYIAVKAMVMYTVALASHTPGIILYWCVLSRTQSPNWLGGQSLNTTAPGFTSSGT